MCLCGLYKQNLFMMCTVTGIVFVWCVQSEGLCMCVCVVCTDRRT